MPQCRDRLAAVFHQYVPPGDDFGGHRVFMSIPCRSVRFVAPLSQYDGVFSFRYLFSADFDILFMPIR